MKSRILLCCLIGISPLVYIAINSVGVAFALTEGDITVTGNDNTWVTSGNGENQIDTPNVAIVIESNGDLNSLQCKLERADGSIVNDFDDCLDTPSAGSVDYEDLNGEYTFFLRIVPGDGSVTTTFSYDFNTFGASGGFAAPDIETAETVHPCRTNQNVTEPILAQAQKNLVNAKQADNSGNATLAQDEIREAQDYLFEVLNIYNILCRS